MTSSPGTYALILRCDAAREIEVGRRGPLAVLPGHYVYVGSARGPGGVRARVERHVRRDKPLRWHLDYLRPVVTPVRLWYAGGTEVLEHRWAEALAALREAVAVPGFGSSDCRCPTHLFAMARRPALAPFTRAVGRRVRVWVFQGND